MGDRQRHAGHEQQLRRLRVQRDAGAGVRERGRPAGVVSVAAAGNGGTCAGTGDSDRVPGEILVGHRGGGDQTATGRACVLLERRDPTVAHRRAGRADQFDDQELAVTVRTGTGPRWRRRTWPGPSALLVGRGVIRRRTANGRVNDEVRNILALSAQDLGVAGRDPLHGFGRVDVPAALTHTTVPLTVGVSSVSYAAAGGRGKDLVADAGGSLQPGGPAAWRRCFFDVDAQRRVLQERDRNDQQQWLGVVHVQERARRNLPGRGDRGRRHWTQLGSGHSGQQLRQGPAQSIGAGAPSGPRPSFVPARTSPVSPP